MKRNNYIFHKKTGHYFIFFLNFFLNKKKEKKENPYTTPRIPRGGPTRHSGGGATTLGPFGGVCDHSGPPPTLLVVGRPPIGVIGHPLKNKFFFFLNNLSFFFNIFLKNNVWFFLVILIGFQ